MAMILQVIFAVCCFVEIISPQVVLPIKTKLEIARFNKSLSQLCVPIKQSNEDCGLVPIIKLLTNQSTLEMCSGYKHEFGKVHCALKNITYNHCNNNGTIKSLRKIAEDLSGGSHNETCNGRMSYMRRFCLEVQRYINVFHDEC